MNMLSIYSCISCIDYCDLNRRSSCVIQLVYYKKQKYAIVMKIGTPVAVLSYLINSLGFFSEDRKYDLWNAVWIVLKCVQDSWKMRGGLSLQRDWYEFTWKHTWSWGRLGEQNHVHKTDSDLTRRLTLFYCKWSVCSLLLIEMLLKQVWIHMSIVHETTLYKNISKQVNIIGWACARTFLLLSISLIFFVFLDCSSSTITYVIVLGHIRSRDYT